MKKGWELKKLGDVCYSKSSNVAQNQLADEVGDYPIFGASGLIKNVSFYHRDKPYLSIVKDGSGFGRITKMDAFTSVIGTLQYILPNDDIDLDYLNYSLMSVDFKKYVQGAAIPHIYFKDYKNEPFLWMPLSEQQHIVAILDEVFAAIAKARTNAEQNLKNAKELFESYLQGVFENKGEGWVSATIGETCNLQTGGTPSTNKKEFYEGGTIKWLVSGDINQKVINDCEGRITELGMNSSNTKYLPINSVLIALNGQGKTRGTVAMLRTKATCNQSLVSIFPKDEKLLLPELVFSNLEGRYDEIRKITGDSGNDRRGLNMPLIRSIKFSYPKKINEQKEIIKKLDNLRAETKKLEAIYIQKINDLEELKKAVLQKAFIGELKTAKALV